MLIHLKQYFVSKLDAVQHWIKDRGINAIVAAIIAGVLVFIGVRAQARYDQWTAPHFLTEARTYYWLAGGIVVILAIIGLVVLFRRKPTWRTKVWKSRGWFGGILAAAASISLVLFSYNRIVDRQAKAKQAQAAVRTAAENKLASDLEHPLFVVNVDSLHCIDSTFDIALSGELSGILVIPWNYRIEFFWPIESTLPFAAHVDGFPDTEYWPGNPPKDIPHTGRIQLRALAGRTGNISVRIFPLGKTCKKTALIRAPSTVEIPKTAPPVQLYGRFFFCRFLHND